jgi:hypothetical protein
VQTVLEADRERRRDNERAATEAAARDMARANSSGGPEHRRQRR